MIKEEKKKNFSNYTFFLNGYKEVVWLLIFLDIQSHIDWFLFGKKKEIEVKEETIYTFLSIKPLIDFRHCVKLPVDQKQAFYYEFAHCKHAIKNATSLN